MERAVLALERGWDPDRIVGPTMFSEGGWSGEESAHWQSKLDRFEELRANGDGDVRRESIIDAGILMFSDLRDRASAREREERVFGYRPQ